MKIINEIYTVHRPEKKTLPIFIHVPHAGTKFPEELASLYKQNILDHPEDTDWFVHELYGFAPSMGITLMHANMSRYVIDLNRHPGNKKLYSDARVETALLPTHTFSGEEIYCNGHQPDQVEIDERKMAYYLPYYDRIELELFLLQEIHPQILFFDAHSIRPFVPSIQKERFPDLILGNRNGKTAHPAVIDSAWNILQNSNYSSSHNHPFQGGHLTRFHGKPERNIHALQLEMSQSVYLESVENPEKTKNFPSSLPSSEKVTRIQSLLEKMFLQLAETLRTL